MIEAFDASGRSNIGHALETAVFNELDRRSADITYVRTADGGEVDFLARFPSGREELIQVCADPSDPETLAREVEGLAAAAAGHPRAARRLIVLDGATVGRMKLPKTEIHAAYEWLLDTRE